MIISGVAFLRSTAGTSPCPVCDAELKVPDTDRQPEACPECGATLLPLRVASGRRRIAAFVVDALVLTLTAGPLAWGLAWVVDLPPLVDGQGVDAALQLMAGDLSRPVRRALPFVTMAVTYFVVFGALTGQTPGQRATKIRLVDRAGTTPGLLRTLLRSVAGLFALIPMGLGALWMLFDTDRRAFHDHLAQTYVVKT